MKFIENKRFQKHKIIDLENGDSDCVISYSKRAAEFDESDFDESLYDAFEETQKRDDFGIVSLHHGLFEFLIEETNLGFHVRGFYCGRPDYSLDKLGFGYTLRDLLE